MSRSVLGTLFISLLCLIHTVQAFLGSWSGTSYCSSRVLSVANTVNDDGDVLIYSDEFEDGIPPDEEDDDSDYESSSVPWKKNARWNSLNPKIKARMRKQAQQRAIANKKKREPAEAKKRRLLMMYKQSQQDKKRDSRVKRPIPFHDRTPLVALEVGMEMTGTVISLTKFGAYIDVGTECDGLLHISQISNTYFVEHPRQVMTPGDEVTVRISSVNPDRKKLQLSMLPVQGITDLEEEEEDNDDDEDRISLEEIDVHDELWGEIRRVTSYGAYVELGAVVDGFLHFMDHPDFAANVGSPPNEFMAVGDRIRTWVSNVDMDKMRIKLTANRPQHLPGPRREIY